MGKMMNFGRRTTPLTTDPKTGARIADPSVYGKKFGTGQDQITVSSWPEKRDAWRKLKPGEREDYTNYGNTQVANYMLGKTNILDDVNIEEPTYTGGKENIASATSSLKPTGLTYKDVLRQFGLDVNRENANLYIKSGMSLEDWEKQPHKVTHSANPLDLNPLAPGMKFDLPVGEIVGDRWNTTPNQIYDIRYVKPPAVDEKKEIAKPVITSKVKTPAETKVNVPIKKEELSNKDLVIDRLPIRGVGQIEREEVRMKRIADPNEPVYYGAGMLEDTSPKALKVQRETSYNREKRGEEIAKSYETGGRIQFAPGGAINKKDLRLQAKYNRQYDKFQKEKDKNPMNNKTLDLFYSKRFGQ